MAPLFKNCRPTAANLGSAGAPWSPGEERRVTDDQAAVLRRVSGFREIAVEQPKELTHKELKAQAGELGLSKAGSKAEIAERIAAAEADNIED